MKLSIKSKDLIGHNIEGLNLIKVNYYIFSNKKMMKWSIVWLKRNNDVNMLHANMYYN
jgi:hypothetical protein